MVDSLLPQLMNQFTPAIEDGISQKLGIDKGMVHQALLVAIPFILAAVTKKMATPEGQADIGKILQQAGQAPSAGASPSGASGDQADVMVSSIFGDSAPQIGKAIGSSTGVDGTQLLGLATPTVMSGLSQFQQSQGLDNAGLAGALNQQMQVMGKDNPEMMTMTNSAMGSQQAGGIFGAVKKLFGM